MDPTCRYHEQTVSTMFIASVRVIIYRKDHLQPHLHVKFPRKA